MSSQQIDVVVTGEDPDAVQLVTGVINKALLDNEFNNVGVMHPFTGEPTLVPDVPSLYALIKHSKPSIFKEPITVTGIPVPSYDKLPEAWTQHAKAIEQYPNAAGVKVLKNMMNRVTGQMAESFEKAGKEVTEFAEAHTKAKKIRAKTTADDQPTAAELSDAAKTMSKAAHKDDNHKPAKDTKDVAHTLAEKALDAA
jgi:hypothetical protein